MSRRARLWIAVWTVLAGALAGPIAEARAARANWSRLMKEPDAWFQSPQGQETVATVLANQMKEGDWPKDVDTTKPLKLSARAHGTFDNSATTSEVRFLARARAARPDPKIDAAIERAVRMILRAQYPNGGWPQFSPPGKEYPRHITFNDNTMVLLMQLLRDVAHDPAFAFLPGDVKAQSARAFDAGIQCILACQVRDRAGKRLVWCAQHDAKTLEPRPARAYELVSLSGAESAGILRLLMSLDNPSPAVRQAVDAGAAWFAASAIKGVREVTVKGDKTIVADPSAPPIWARFYEIDTNRPFFCGRDGIKKYDLAEIESERRNGYAWYGNWGDSVATTHARWSRRNARK